MPNQKTMKRKLTRQRAKARAGGGNVAVSRNVPTPTYHQTHVLGVAQSLRRTMTLNGGANTLLTTGTYVEPSVIILNGFFNMIASMQPAGYAKYMALYSKCFPLGARCRIKFAMCASTGSGANTSPAFLGAVITTNTTSLGSLAGAVDAGLVDYKLLNQSPDSCEIELSVDFAKFVDKPQILDDPQWFSTITANPTQVIVLHVFAESVIATAGCQLVHNYEIDIDCVYTDPIPFT
jgi:hypothetical protein